jgi:hypothetical protein
MKTLLPFVLCLSLYTASAQSTAQPTSPNGDYTLQRKTDGTWAIFDNAHNVLNTVTPRLPAYDKIVTSWAPDSEKVAILAMTLKSSDIYILGTKGTYTVPSPSLATLKAAAMPHAQFQYNPQSYSFADRGAVSVSWVSPEELQVRTEFVANLSDTHLGHQDHWKFIISYGYALGAEDGPKNLQVIKTRQE